jgi:hypothetical protein
MLTGVTKAGSLDTDTIRDRRLEILKALAEADAVQA